MIPSSVRRVVATAPQSHHLLASLTSSTPRAAAAASTGLARGHQRRCSSSSKPSRPGNDGAAPLAPGQQSVPASSRSEAKAAGSEKRRRKTKDEKEAAASAKRLPSVPSTQHLSQEALALSTFFSMHRPISVTHSIPKSVSDDAFAAIFASRTRTNKMSDVISTLSRTVDDLEGPMAEMTISTKHDADGSHAGDGMHKIDVKHADGTESSVYVQLNAMTGQFLPFRPPPTPQPKTPAEIEAAEAEEEAAAVMSNATVGEGSVDETATAAAVVPAAEAEEEAPHHRVYRAMFTIEETTDGDGQVRVVAHSPQILGEGEDALRLQHQQQNQQPRSFLERMALRQLRFEDAQAQRREANAMLAISVMRQRKLKMKKKKYKKLLKRTRNERRRLGRL